MIIYHGSFQEIKFPNIAFSRTRLDFGQGFYTTPIKQQAVSWAERFKQKNKDAIINCYEFDEGLFTQYRTKEFYSYSEQWLDFIIANRTQQPVDEYDIIIGGIANDKVFNTIELLLENLITRQEALGRLIYEENNLQICFRQQQIIEQHLIFKGSEKV